MELYHQISLIGRPILIRKKGSPMNCAKYKTISLLYHASKIIFNIIKNRIKGKIEPNLEEDQFGFRSGRRTIEAILTL